MIDKEKREWREAMLFYSAAKASLKYKGKSAFEKILKILLEGSFVSENCQDCSKDISGAKTKKTRFGWAPKLELCKLLKHKTWKFSISSIISFLPQFLYTALYRM